MVTQRMLRRAFEVLKKSQRMAHKSLLFLTSRVPATSQETAREPSSGLCLAPEGLPDQRVTRSRDSSSLLFCFANSF